MSDNRREQSEADKRRAARRAEYRRLLDQLPAAVPKKPRKSPIVKAFGFGAILGKKKTIAEAAE